MNPGFIVSFHNQENGEFLGHEFGSSHLGGQLPEIGDIIIAPDSKHDFRSGDSTKFYAHEVTRRYIVPDVTDPETPMIAKLFVKRRQLTESEKSLVPTASPRAE